MPAQEMLTLEDIEQLARNYAASAIIFLEISRELEKSRAEVEKLRREIDSVPEGDPVGVREALERLLRDERRNADLIDQERVRVAAVCELWREEFKNQSAEFREYHANRGGFTHVFTRPSSALAVANMCKFDDHPGFKNGTFSIGDSVSPAARRAIVSIFNCNGIPFH